MFIGVLEITLFIPNAASLKDKRHVVKSLIETTRQKFNVSIAEVDHLDKWQVATIGIACVANEHKYLNTVLDKVIDLIESSPLYEVTGIERSIE